MSSGHLLKSFRALPVDSGLLGTSLSKESDVRFGTVARLAIPGRADLPPDRVSWVSLVDPARLVKSAVTSVL